MPRTSPLTAIQRNRNDKKLITEKLLADIAVKRIKKIDLAAEIGISPGALSQQLKKNDISMDTFVAWQRLSREREK